MLITLQSYNRLIPKNCENRHFDVEAEVVPFCPMSHRWDKWDKWDKVGQVGQSGTKWDKWDKWDKVGQSGTNGTSGTKWDKMGIVGGGQHFGATMALMSTFIVIFDSIYIYRPKPKPDI